MKTIGLILILTTSALLLAACSADSAQRFVNWSNNQPAPTGPATMPSAEAIAGAIANMTQKPEVRAIADPFPLGNTILDLIYLSATATAGIFATWKAREARQARQAALEVHAEAAGWKNPGQAWTPATAMMLPPE